MAEVVTVVEIAGTPICVAVEDGHKVHDVIAKRLAAGTPVEISFVGVRRLTTAFLNAAIGQLYNEFSEEVVGRLVTAPNVDAITADLLRKVIERAKSFYKETARHEAAAKRVLDGEQ